MNLKYRSGVAAVGLEDRIKERSFDRDLRFASVMLLGISLMK